MTTRNLATPPVIAEGLFSFQIGGSERVGADLAIEFAARGYSVICFAFYDTQGPIRTELEARGIECVDLNYLTRNRYVRRLTYQVEFYRFLRKRQVAGLHVHHATALFLCGIPARIARTPRVAMTEHAIHQLVERPDYRATAIRYCKYAHSISAVHAGIGQYFNEEMKVPQERIQVIANGVHIGIRDSETRKKCRAALAISEDHFCLLFAGRLELVKDVGTLLHAIALLAAGIRRKIKLLLAGDGSQRQALEQLARNLGIESTIEFLGIRTDIPNLLSAADGFIMTSITEGLPMALIEAMGAGVPSIATAVGGIPELFANSAGLLIQPGHPAEAAAAIERLVADPSLRNQIVTAGLARAKESHDLESIVTQYLAILGLPAHWPADGEQNRP